MSKLPNIPLNGANRTTCIKRKIVNNCKVAHTGCWIWQGSTSGHEGSTRGHGYGRITIHGQTCAVHRVMFMSYFGFIPSKIQVDHTCGNRLCCNPAHLEAVKQNENMRRAYSRRNNNRQPVGK